MDVNLHKRATYKSKDAAKALYDERKVLYIREISSFLPRSSLKLLLYAAQFK